MKVILSKEAQKNYTHFPISEQKKIKKKLLSLEENPYGGKKLEGQLSGYRSVRVWPYRIIYQVNEKEQRVEVSDILHRQGAYK